MAIISIVFIYENDFELFKFLKICKYREYRCNKE